MRRRSISLLLAMVLLLAALPVTAFAANPAQDIAVFAPVYTDGKLTSISTEFKWGYGFASVGKAFLALSSKYLDGQTSSSDTKWGDFSDYGRVDNNFDFQSYAEVKAHNGNEFELITASNETSLTSGKKKTITFDMSASPIAPVEGSKYYVYLWVYYNANYFPDQLITVIQFKDGKWSYSPGTGNYRNQYDSSANAFKEVTPESPSQDPDEPTQHTCIKSSWLSDETHHWRFCQAENHPSNNSRALTMIDYGPHVYTDDRDPDCNTCDYVRNMPDNGPATGDITNIPLWTMLLFAGAALMYVQLTQRKREQF